VTATLPRHGRRLHLEPGDRVLATEKGILLTPYAPNVERALQIAASAARKYRNALSADAIHLDQLREHDGLQGIRDENILESALVRARNKWAYDGIHDLPTLAAAYGYGLATSHPYHDGNKRIAFLAMVIFLGLNGWKLDAPESAVVTTLVAGASRQCSEAEFADWLRAHIDLFCCSIELLAKPTV